MKRSIYTKITLYLMASVTLILLVWDIIVAVKTGGRATESYLLLFLASVKGHMVIPYAWGVLTTHFWVPRKSVPEGMLKIITLTVFGTITLFVLGVDLLNHFLGLKIAAIIFLGQHLYISLLSGCLVGWGLFPQKKITI